MRYWYSNPQLKSFTEDDFVNKEVTLHGFVGSYFRTPYSPSDPLNAWPEVLPPPSRIKETEASILLFWDLEDPVRLSCHAKMVEVVWNAHTMLLDAPIDFPVAFERLQLGVRPLTPKEASQERLRAILLLHV